MSPPQSNPTKRLVSWLRGGDARPPLTSETFFRRAEGLSVAYDACAGTLSLAGAPLSSAQLALLGRLSPWATAAELGVPLQALVELEARNAVFWSTTRPTRVLTGAPLPQRIGPVRLRGNVWPKVLLQREDRVDVFPFMARRGMLDDAQVVGLQCGVFEWGKKTLELRVACCARHGEALRRLLPGLAGTRRWEELAQDALVLPCLEVMDTLGLLEEAANARTVRQDSAVTWLGHASVLFEAGGTRVLVDPLFHPRSIPRRANAQDPPDPRELGHIDAVLITHGDNDHLNPQALQWLPPDTPVFIPRPAQRKPYQVDMEGVLRVLGFTRVTALAAWEQVRVGGVDVTAAPFVGEDWGLTLPCCTWVLRHPTLSVYLSADATVMEDVYARVAAQGPVDLAFLGVTGCAETYLSPPGFGYGNFYAVWIPKSLRNRWVELCAGPEESARAAVLLGARRAFGYAAGGADFIPTAFSDRGDHAQLAAALERAGHGGVPISLPLGERVPASAL